MIYKTFIVKLKSLLESVDRYELDPAAARAAMKAYWDAGRDADAWQRATGTLIKEIALDIGASKGTLEKYVRFYRLYSDGYKEEMDGFVFQWSHYAVLLYVSSRDAREFYLNQTARGRWSSHELRRRIRANFYENRLEARDKGKKETPLKTISQQLYTYCASVKKVIDGDTLLLDIDVGFFTRIEHKVRLRGINCPEKGTLKGEKATKFVEKELLCGSDLKKPKKLPEALVVIRSYKSEKFGRFLVDLWYMKGETDKERILKEGLLLNQVLLDKKLARKVE